MMRTVESLTMEDFQAHPVWKLLTGNDRNGVESYVEPVVRLPVSSGDDLIFFTTLKLNDGTNVKGLISNLDINDPRITRHFLLLSIFVGKNQYYLSRYFDVDYDERGPVNLATVLQKSIDKIFPITYNLSGLAAGHPECISGEVSIISESEQLSRFEILDLLMNNIKRKL